MFLCCVCGNVKVIEIFIFLFAYSKERKMNTFIWQIDIFMMRQPYDSSKTKVLAVSKNVLAFYS